MLSLSQPLISQHLRILKDSNLVIDERSGQEIFYAVNAEYTLKLLQNLITDIKHTKA
jgi:DNA-binding transcriptional ArsR family regulator